MKNLRNKGISLISLTVAVCILIVISSMLIYNAKSGVNIRKLKMMQNDIATLDDAINSYYAKYGALPVKIEYNVMPLPFYDERSQNDNEVYYVIDLTALEGITLNYGVDYEHINTQEDLLENEDVYVINEQSHRIYYARGIEMDGVVYYTNEQDEDVALRLKQWSQAVLDDKGDMYALDTFGELYMINMSYSGTIQENKDYVKVSDFWKDASILQGKNIIKVSAGWDYTVALDKNGKVYTWGYNDNGQLGNGTTIDSKIPICISDIFGNILNGKKIKQIAVGEGHTVALDEQGKVYTWGNNQFGKLGDGTTSNRIEPICISDISGNPLQTKTITQIVVGSDHTVALDEQGKVYTWGWNFCGELGDGIIEMGPGGNYSNIPICISNIPEHPLQTEIIIQISAGDEYTAVLDKEGKVYTWGLNGSGRLGDGETQNRNIPKCISDIPGNKLNGKKIVKISAGDTHAVAIDEDGKVYTWGNNDGGKLGDGTTTTGYRDYRNIPMCISDVFLQDETIVDISAGGYHTIAIDVEGKVYTWGSQEYLGKEIGEDSQDSNEPICISDIEEHVFQGKKIKQISAGTLHAIVMDEEGTIYAWGNNDNGQLGTGTRINSDLPISINTAVENEILGKKIVKISSSGSGRIVALDNEGKVYTWGDNDYGQLGDGTIQNRALPICISDIEGEDNDLYNKKIVYISVGYCYTVALDKDGKVYTWGNNYDGQLGDGTIDDIAFPKCISDINVEDNDLYNTKIVDISAGYFNTIALDEEGKVYAWGVNLIGYNNPGLLGDETTSYFPVCVNDDISGSILKGRNIKKIEVDEICSVVIDDKGNLIIFGDWTYG